MCSNHRGSKWKMQLKMSSAIIVMILNKTKAQRVNQLLNLFQQGKIHLSRSRKCEIVSVKNKNYLKSRMLSSRWLQHHRATRKVSGDHRQRSRSKIKFISHRIGTSLIRLKCWFIVVPKITLSHQLSERACKTSKFRNLARNELTETFNSRHQPS